MNFRRKKGRWVLSLLTGLLFIAIILIVGNTLYAQIKKDVPSFFGYSVINIISTSMEPAIPENTFILIERVSIEDVKIGDIITFYSKDPTIRGSLNTHRAVDFDVKSSDRRIITKGDANLINDNYKVEREDLVGKHVKNLVTFGKFGRIFQNKFFIIGIILIPAIILFVMEIVNFTGTIKRKEEEPLSLEDEQDD